MFESGLALKLNWPTQPRYLSVNFSALAHAIGQA